MSYTIFKFKDLKPKNGFKLQASASTASMSDGNKQDLEEMENEYADFTEINSGTDSEEKIDTGSGIDEDEESYDVVVDEEREDALAFENNFIIESVENDDSII
jgi:hypothetical protein